MEAKSSTVLSLMSPRENRADCLNCGAQDHYREIHKDSNQELMVAHGFWTDT